MVVGVGGLVVDHHSHIINMSLPYWGLDAYGYSEGVDSTIECGGMWCSALYMEGSGTLKIENNVRDGGVSEGHIAL